MHISSSFHPHRKEIGTATPKQFRPTGALDVTCHTSVIILTGEAGWPFPAAR